MDDNLKAISLAAGTDAGGIAVAPDGVVWGTDKRDAPTGTVGQLFSILPDGSKYDAHPLPKVPDARKESQPAYVALQTSSHSVEAVWVSDIGAGQWGSAPNYTFKYVDSILTIHRRKICFRRAGRARIVHDAHVTLRPQQQEESLHKVSAYCRSLSVFFQASFKSLPALYAGGIHWP